MQNFSPNRNVNDKKTKQNKTRKQQTQTKKANKKD